MINIRQTEIRNLQEGNCCKRFPGLKQPSNDNTRPLIGAYRQLRKIINLENKRGNFGWRFRMKNSQEALKVCESALDLGLCIKS
ncbi:hypothetical protein WN943_027060 [Citrus x changshan-huyou]